MTKEFAINFEVLHMGEGLQNKSIIVEADTKEQAEKMLCDIYLVTEIKEVRELD